MLNTTLFWACGGRRAEGFIDAIEANGRAHSDDPDITFVRHGPSSIVATYRGAPLDVTELNDLSLQFPDVLIVHRCGQRGVRGGYDISSRWASHAPMDLAGRALATELMELITALQLMWESQWERDDLDLAIPLCESVRVIRSDSGVTDGGSPLAPTLRAEVPLAKTAAPRDEPQCA